MWLWADWIIPLSRISKLLYILRFVHTGCPLQYRPHVLVEFKSINRAGHFKWHIPVSILGVCLDVCSLKLYSQLWGDQVLVENILILCKIHDAINLSMILSMTNHQTDPKHYHIIQLVSFSLHAVLFPRPNMLMVCNQVFVMDVTFNSWSINKIFW